MSRSWGAGLGVLLLAAAALAQEQTAEAHFAAGKRHHKAKRYQEALKAFDRALALDGKLVTARAWRGDCRLKLKDAEGAIADFDAAIAKKGTAWLWRRRGLARWRLKRYAEAGADFGRAAQQGDLLSLHYRGVMRVRAKNPIGGVLDLRALLERDPKHPAAKRSQALIDKHGRWDEKTTQAVARWQERLAGPKRELAVKKLVRSSERSRKSALGAWLRSLAYEYALHSDKKLRVAVFAFVPTAGVYDRDGVMLKRDEAFAAAPRLLPLLRLGLADDHWFVRQRAVEGARYHEASETVALLRARLERDSSFAVRHNAARILGVLGPKLARPALPALGAALKTSHPKLRFAAARAVGSLGPPVSASIVSDLRAFVPDRRVPPDLRLEAASTLAKLGVAEALPDVLALVDEPALPKPLYLSKVLAMRVVAEFGKHALPVVPKLLTIYFDEGRERDLRLSAGLVLRKLMPLGAVLPAEAAGRVRRLAETTAERKLRENAYRLLGSTARTDALLFLQERLLAVKSVHETRPLVEAIGLAGAKAADVLPLLIENLRKFKADTKSYALTAYLDCFVQIGAKAKVVIPELQRFLQGHWKDRARRAIAALEKL